MLPTSLATIRIANLIIRGADLVHPKKLLELPTTKACAALMLPALQPLHHVALALKWLELTSSISLVGWRCAVLRAPQGVRYLYSTNKGHLDAAGAGHLTSSFTKWKAVWCCRGMEGFTAQHESNIVHGLLKCGLAHNHSTATKTLSPPHLACISIQLKQDMIGENAAQCHPKTLSVICHLSSVRYVLGPRWVRTGLDWDAVLLHRTEGVDWEVSQA